MKNLFKKLRKQINHKWRRGGQRTQWWEPMVGGSSNAGRWAHEEIDHEMYQNFFPMATMVGDVEPGMEKSVKEKADARIEKKPREVFEELTAETPNLDLTDLPAKIKAMQKRVDFMTDDLGLHATEEKNVLGWLKAREQGLKKGIMKEFDWPVTTTKKVATLLKKYKLAKSSLSQYSLAVPEEAIEEMEKYVALHKKVVEGNPEFILIVPDTPEFKQKKRDPILLATSPFGKFLHVLGAWDKEVEIMHELYFENK